MLDLRAVRRSIRRWALWPLFVSGLSASPALADVYSWVDETGVIHLTDVRPRIIHGSQLPEARGFGGKPLRVLTYPDGEKRTLYAVDVTEFDPIFEKAALHYRLPTAFLKAIAKVESNFDHRAVSRVQAKGLMQLMDSTARTLNVRDSFDPEQNVFGGTRYLRILANQFEGDLTLTTAAYNAGPARVARVRRVPNIPETQRYVKRVLTMYEYYGRRKR
jgi:soluble lytic murein transglycosylase-like protein